MNAFDTIVAAHAIEATGLNRAQAEVIAQTAVEASRAAQGQATKSDIALVRADLRDEITGVKNDLHAAITGVKKDLFWMKSIGCTIAALLLALVVIFGRLAFVIPGGG
ncbi:MAG: hypothetical protein GDA52_01625 [Rhodobacteraceae bacterium]|nr:hypothetical protein [Paracoccaceae bacterium]